MTKRNLTLSSVVATEAFAASLALWIRPGFVIHLAGDLGSGKSTLARALIRAVAGHPELDVPSPTFSLIQTYSDLRVPIAHVDLYRLSGSRDTEELGLADLSRDHAVLIEWPERLNGQQLSPDTLKLQLSGQGDTRNIVIDASGKWRSVLARDAVIEHTLTAAKVDPASRQFLLGDASTRRYETVEWNRSRALLMDMPARSDHAIVKHGKSYSALVHLADEIGAVLAINHHLSGLGYSAPIIHHADRESGLAIMDLFDGDVHGTMMLRGDDMTEPMQCAVAVLADMTQRQWPRHVSAGRGTEHTVPDFDLDALLYEVDLMPSWFWPQLHGTAAPPAIHESFEHVWRKILPLSFDAPRVWVLRDYHSPNLLWLPQRQGLQRTGIIDTQDAVMGNAAYDLASLLQDARVDVDPGFQQKLYAHYVELRRAQGNFDEQAFARDYAILGAQRASRLLGTFTRLSKRDGKHHYLQHRPRVARYLVQNLAHPVLSPLRDWYEQNLPDVLKLAST
jgi:N-acetylmuramate 1-kinase